MDEYKTAVTEEFLKGLRAQRDEGAAAGVPRRLLGQLDVTIEATETELRRMRLSTRLAGIR